MLAVYGAEGAHMHDPVSQAQVDAAKAYEALFVPALFGQWASKVADAADIRPGLRVLDVACGTGVLARAVHSRTGPWRDAGPSALFFGGVSRHWRPRSVTVWRTGTA